MRASVLLLISVTLGACYGPSRAANILYFSLTPSPSHNIWDKTIAMALRERGHNITYVTHSHEKSTENFTAIIIEGVYEALAQAVDYKEMGTLGPIQMLQAWLDWVHLISEVSLNSNGTQKLLNETMNNPKFDLILFDATNGQYFYPFIEKFNSPPVIATSPFGLAPHFYFFFGSDVDASFIPIFMLLATDQMTFFQRFSNYFYTILYQLWRQHIVMPAQWALAENFFGKDIIPYQEIERNFSFLLANYDPNFDYPRSLPPAIIPVGGLHTRREKSLPQDLKKYLDNATDGAILFSLGTNIRSDSLGEKNIKELIQAFSQLKQTVIWKFESNIQNLPKNVIVRPWLPQNDILAHPNTKLFISHGGALSTQEAMYHKIPLVGLPVFADQYLNMLKITSRKLGLQLDYQTLTSKTIVDTIQEVLNNPIYRKTAEEVSSRYRDQPQDALSRAVFWVEYALRHGGGQHLRIAPRDMFFYQIYYLDIWAFVITITIVIYVVIRRLCSAVFRPVKKTKLKKK